MRNDNRTNFAYVGSGDGMTPPEIYNAFHPGDMTDVSPIFPTNPTILRNQQTGLYCRLAPFSPQTTCLTQGMLCDQSSPSTATVMTYTGTGLAYQGTPLVQEPTTGSLVLSSNPACSVPGGDRQTFPPGDRRVATIGCCMPQP